MSATVQIPSMDVQGTALGVIWYGGTAGAGAELAGNTTATRQFLRQTGTGAVSAAPAWDTIQAGDIAGLSPTFAAIIANSLTSPGSADLTLAAGATNQNVILSPAGTGILSWLAPAVSTDSSSYRTWQGDSGVLARGNFIQRQSSNAGLYCLSVGHNNQWIGYRAEGTFGAITATATGGNMVAIFAGAWDGSAWVYPASITLTSAENFTTSAHGTRIIFSGTVAGSLTAASFEFSGNGNVLVGTTSNTGLTGSGGIKAASTTDSTSATTGSIITAGGVGIAKSLFVGTTINTGDPNNGAGAWLLGKIRTGVALVVSTTAGLQVKIDGTLYTLALLTTNP